LVSLQLGESRLTISDQQKQNVFKPAGQAIFSALPSSLRIAWEGVLQEVDVRHQMGEQEAMMAIDTSQQRCLQIRQLLL